MILRTTWLIGALLLSPQQASELKPQEKPQPFWERCEDVEPWQRADDNSTFHVCIDHTEKRWQVVDRFIDKECVETLPKVPDTYQHFMCNAKYELMIRPEHRKEVPRETKPAAHEAESR